MCRWILPISETSSATLTNLDKIILKQADATWEEQNTCTFLPTKKLQGLRREHLACILSRLHKVNIQTLFDHFYLGNYNKRKNSKNKAFNIFYFYILAFIICWYAEPTMPEQAATVTEKLGDYLIQVGY